MLKRMWLGIAKRALKYSGIPLRDPALVAIFGKNDVTSGVDVNEDTALNFSAVYSAVNLISSTVGLMPAKLYDKKPSTGKDNPLRERHIVNHLLSTEPNKHTVPFVFHQTHQAHALTYGNSYIEIIREQGVPVGLRSLMPDAVYPKDGDNGIDYVINEWDEDRKQNRVIASEDMIHIPGLAYDGLRGYSVIARARESIGLGLATERYGASFFGRGAIPGGIITHPGDLTTEAEANLARDFERKHRTPDNGHRIAILDEGMKYQQIGIPPEDSQFLQTRQFQIVEIARWFRVPPHMLFDMTQATFSNIEQQNMDFLVYTILPWLVKWQQEYTRKLLTEDEREKWYVGHDVSILLKADMQTRYNSYSTGHNGGWLTLNDILQKESMPTLPPEIGDMRLSPSTMKVLGKSDPSTPIDVATMQSALDLLTKNGPYSKTDAKQILNAAMPTASDEFIASLLANSKSVV